MARRLALTLAVAAAATSAAPALGAPIQVSINGGPYAAFDQTQGPLIDETMAVPDAPNTNAKRYAGWSFQQLAGSYGANRGITSALVSDAGNQSQSVSQADIYDGSNLDGENGGAAEFPVFGAIEGQPDSLWFALPGASDHVQGRYIPNAARGSADLSLYVQITTDGTRPLRVDAIQTTPGKPRPNGEVTFTTAVSNEASGPLTYAWSFGDGTPAGGDAAPTHAFAAGNWPIQVTVTDGQGNHGVSPLLDLVVADPAPQTTATPTAGGTGASDALPTGPVSGGQTPSSAPTPAPAAGKPRHSPTSGSTPRKKTPAKGEDRTLKQATATPTVSSPSPAPTPVTTPESRTAPTGRPRSVGLGGRDRTPVSPPVGTPAPALPKAAVGVVIGTSDSDPAADPVAAALAQRLAAAREAVASEQVHSGHTLETLIGVVVALIVLALGALREFDPRARYRRLAT